MYLFHLIIWCYWFSANVKDILESLAIIGKNTKKKINEIKSDQMKEEECRRINWKEKELLQLVIKQKKRLNAVCVIYTYA